MARIELTTARRDAGACARRVWLGAVLLHAALLTACGNEGGATPGTGGTTTLPPPTGGAVAMTGGAATGGAETTGGVGAGAGGTAGAAVTGGTAGTAVTGGSGGSVAGAGAGGGGAPGGSGGDGGSGGGSAGVGGGGSGGMGPEAPAMLSLTGLFSARVGGELVLADGVREFEPRYWLWSDGADKQRYVYLPPGTQIDTSDPDHWVFPAGAKFWKSFISGGQLVETRLIERTGDGPNDVLYATYYWDTAEATDAVKVPYRDQYMNAGMPMTTHDVPNGSMCERCHNLLQEHVLGFSALQLNHDRGGVDLETLLNEGLLTDPISLDIQVPGDDEPTREALGYLHANCGNCHNDSPGLPVESVPEPQMFLRLSVNDLTLEDTDVFQTAINQATTASAEIGLDYRIQGGSIEESTIYYRMNERGIEDQMPPIGTQDTDPDGLELISSWIQSLPPPPP